MNFSSHFQPLAQAYLLEGHHLAIKKDLLSVLEGDHLANPDFYNQHFTTFTIEDARKIKDAASKKKISEGRRIFIIAADNITHGASNALLKTLEEPGKDTHFFLIVPSVKRILPTIISRVRVVRRDSADETKGISPEAFLSLSPAQRLAQVKELLGKLEKEEISKADIAAFVEDLLRYQHAKDPSMNLEKEAVIMSYNRDQSASLKMILEYLALSI